MDITKLVQLILALSVCLTTTFLIPWLRTKLGDAKFTEMTRWIGIFVPAAEQLFRDDAKKKKGYVLTRLRELGYRVDETGVDDAIEATVLELHASLYGKEKEMLKEGEEVRL